VSTADPIGDLAHDHADLNRRVLELGAIVSGRRKPQTSLITSLSELREQLFHHFAREEEGLFPFVSEHFPEVADQVHTMAIAHDAICGAVARMFHLASTEAKPSAIRAVFDRFESAYATHANVETELLRGLDGKLDADQRTQLALLVRDL
jgi:iron-sulfur cluster repair protein YtfE (RIC family)